jgi:hypothetical protein
LSGIVEKIKNNMAASPDSRHNETGGIELNELPTQVIDEKPW